MQISDFDGLVIAAKGQPLPQRMLFVFVRTAIPDDASEQEHARFAAGEGGTLLPLFYVDLGPEEVPSFAAFVAEADERSKDWDKVLIACMDAPRGSQMSVDIALKSMIGRVQTGASLADFVCLSRDGSPIVFG